MISRKPSGERSIVLLGQGQAMQRLWAQCTLQTQNTSDDCHSLAKAPRQLQTQIARGKSSIHGQCYREGMRALTNLLFKWKGVKSLLCAAFWKKTNNNFINQLLPETVVLLSPQRVTTFCSSETLLLVCFCS